MEFISLAYRHLKTLLPALMLPAVLAGQVPATGASLIHNGSGTLASVPLIRLAACYSETPDCPDYTVIYFDDKATYEFDGQLDALKLMNTDIRTPNLYTITPGGTNLSINALPPAAKSLCKIPLGLKTGMSGYIKFKIGDIDSSLSHYGVFLTDTATGTEHNLLPDLEYSVYLQAGDYTGRFFLNVSNISAEIMRHFSDGSSFLIHQNHGILTVSVSSLTGRDGILTVYDITGKPFHEVRVAGPGQYEYHNSFKEGIYIVSLVSGGTRSTKKIFIKNLSL